MEKKIQLLDCTLRDGAYIVDSKFGTPAIKGIIKKMVEANADIIECGWLKNQDHVAGTSFYHVPSDLEQYFVNGKSDRVTFVVMIDWDRYDLSNLPECDGKSIDAIRVVFPHGKFREGIEVGEQIRKKGYKVFFQAANTLSYTDEDLVELAHAMNEVMPVAISIVDTFGAMYFEDVERIVRILDRELNPNIRIGFHSHNNQQLSFALTMHFVDIMQESARNIMVDASLNGMGRGAGNATTELVASYLNKKYQGTYDLNVILDAIDTYMEYFKENYSWGYSTPYFIAGLYCCHVNNIAYLQKNHRTNAEDMKNIISSLSPDERLHYDYDLLESKYVENQSRIVDDEESILNLEKAWKDKEVLLIAPGKSSNEYEESIKTFINENNPIVIGVNAINPKYRFDYLFLTNTVRYQYAKEIYSGEFAATQHIILSNIHTDAAPDEVIINFNRVIKRGWEHFDNAMILALRFLSKVHVQSVAVAGFDGFKSKYNESYADSSLPTLNPDGNWDALNAEISDMYQDFLRTDGKTMQIEFITPSLFDRKDK